MSRKIGILGGAFDPIHYGHLLLASEAADQLNLGRVLFVPTFHSAHQNKEIHTSFGDRCSMVKLAIAGNDDFEISKVESSIEGRSYSVRTLGLLKETTPDAEFFFLIGADNLEQLDTWYQPEELVRLAMLAVAARPGHEIKPPPLDNVTTISMPGIEIAASDIRDRVRKGKSIRFMVPESVAEFIYAKRLYRG